jgi:hypothetical protein
MIYTASRRRTHSCPQCGRASIWPFPCSWWRRGRVGVHHVRTVVSGTRVLDQLLLQVSQVSNDVDPRDR